MNADGTGQTRLTDNTDWDGHPTWSPDGSKIAFVGASDTVYHDIFTMNADGTGRTNITNTNVYQMGYNTEQYPAWSPDGTRIAFTAGGSGSGTEIALMNADGSGRSLLTANDTNDTDPAWSPEGSQIVYVAFGENNSGELHTVAPDGTSDQRITFDTATDRGPAYSPNGKSLVVMRSEGGGGAAFDLYVIAPDGTQLDRFTTSDAFEAAPTWGAYNCQGRLATVAGTSADDVLTGTGGADVIVGLEGNDLIHGLGGDDTLCGGAGNDRIQPGVGSDRVSGGAGLDTGIYSERTTPVLASLDAVANDGAVDEGDNLLADIENLTGGAGNDQLTGGTAANVLTGGGGDDNLRGLAGADTFAGGGGTDQVTYNERSTAVTVTIDNLGDDGAAGEKDNVRTDVENLLGSAGNDRLIGSGAANMLNGSAGNDVLQGLGGSDTFHGGSGGDTVTYGERVAALVVSLNGVANDGAANEYDNVTIDVENVVGGAGNDRLLGSSLVNMLSGGGGNDYLSGYAGNDRLLGGAGTDTADGGDGTDTCEAETRTRC